MEDDLAREGADLRVLLAEEAELPDRRRGGVEQVVVAAEPLLGRLGLAQRLGALGRA